MFVGIGVIDLNKCGSCTYLVQKSKWTSKPHSNLESVAAFNDTMYQGQEKIPSADGRLWKWKTLISISNVLSCTWFPRNTLLLQLKPCLISDIVMCQFIALPNAFPNRCFPWEDREKTEKVNPVYVTTLCGTLEKKLRTQLRLGKE